MNFIKKNKILFVAIILYIITFFYNRGIFSNSLIMTKNFLVEMLEVMPAIMIISALISIWVPQEVIIKNFGKSSGLKGKLFSMLIGSFSAGPIYAAFPVAQSLYFKGASIANIVIIISSWAVTKWVMFMVETSFLGLKFALTRYALTIPMILIMGYIMERLVHKEDMVEEKEEIKKIVEESKEYYLQKLPQKNCGACGHGNCENFAIALSNKEVDINKCIFLKDNS